jgi:hypothetical protein
MVATESFASGATYVLRTGESMYAIPARCGAL